MSDFTSPLQAINRKELELRRRVEEARRRAEGQLQSVREEAKQTIARANQQGQTEAKASYERGIEEARQEGEAIIATASEQATVLRRQAATRLDEAVRQIVKLVLSVDMSLSEDVGLSSSNSALE